MSDTKESNGRGEDALGISHFECERRGQPREVFRHGVARIARQHLVVDRQDEVALRTLAHAPQGLDLRLAEPACVDEDVETALAMHVQLRTGEVCGGRQACT